MKISKSMRRLRLLSSKTLSMQATVVILYIISPVLSSIFCCLFRCGISNVSMCQVIYRSCFFVLTHYILMKHSLRVRSRVKFPCGWYGTTPHFTTQWRLHCTSFGETLVRINTMFSTNAMLVFCNIAIIVAHEIVFFYFEFIYAEMRFLCLFCSELKMIFVFMFVLWQNCLVKCLYGYIVISVQLAIHAAFFA